jgi:hypothetical protein
MLKVYINRKGWQSIEIEDDLLRFPLKPGGKTQLDIDVINCEAPTHIYLSSRGAVKDKVVFNRNNAYVDGEEVLTATISNPLGPEALYEGELSISTGYGSKETSIILQIGHVENETPLDAIEVNEDLSRSDYGRGYRSKQRPTTAIKRPSLRVRWPSLRVDTKRVRRMSNLPYILLGIGVIVALILLAIGRISYGVAILGFIVVVVLAYYTWRLLD